MIKILHTSDWHIGKKIYRVDLSPDHRLFFNWLIQTILDQNIDVLIVSGDVFDLSNPSVESRAIYYDILVKLRNSHCQVVIIGGNHDSPLVLDAPKELLKALNITVVGGFPHNLEHLLVPIQNNNGSIEVVIAAVPFLREPDLQLNLQTDSFELRLAAMRQSMLNIYDSIAKIALLKYPGAPLIATGHFLGIGASISDSERELQIGNLNTVDIESITHNFQYLALGHIHRPQTLKSAIPAYYSGSPLSLSFSEYDDPKRIVTLEVDNKKIQNIHSINIPIFRNLVRLKGSYTEIQQKLAEWSVPAANLPSLIEIEVCEKNSSPNLTMQVQELVDGWQNVNAQIVKFRITFMNAAKNLNQMVDENVQIEELKPVDVFKNMLEGKEILDNERYMLFEAFYELLAEVQESSTIGDIASN